MRYLSRVVRIFPRSSRALRPPLLAALALAAATCVSCKDISRFSTKPGESYCGSIVPAGFVRQTFLPGVRMRLTLDTDHLNDAPGMIVTDDGWFNFANLRPIPQLSHDTLSTISFGEGRERNLLFGVTASEGPQALAIISLLENGDVEVRILRGSSLVPGEDAFASVDGKPLYGIFPMQRQQGTCGF